MARRVGKGLGILLHYAKEINERHTKMSKYIISTIQYNTIGARKIYIYNKLDNTIQLTL